MAIRIDSYVWSSLWILGLFHMAQPERELPLPSIDDCECEAWDRISRKISSDSEFVHCRRDPSCAGTSCSGKFPDVIGPFNLTFRVFACTSPVSMTVHISVPYKGVNWTRNFPAPSKVRVKVPGLQYIVKEMRFSVFIQLNLTKEEARDDVVLGVSLWGKMSTPKTNSTAVDDTWNQVKAVIEHQHLPLPACRDGKHVPEPCGNSSSSSSVTTTTVKPSPSRSPPSLVDRLCVFDSMTTGCDDKEICSQISNSSICVCRRPFHRDDAGVCVAGGGGGGGVTTTPRAATTATSPSVHPSSHGGAIGGTLGALIILALFAALFWWWRKRRNTRLRIVRLYDDEEVLMRNDGYQPVANQEDDNQII